MEYDASYWKTFFATEIGLKRDETITSYAKKFETQGITLQILLEDITEADLEKLDFVMGHRKLIMRYIKDHVTPKTSPTKPNSPTGTPPKKKSKKEEFEEAVASCSNIAVLASKGSCIISDLEKENEAVTAFARMAGCPVKLRWAIENFPIRFLTSTDASFRKQNELHFKLIKLCDHKQTLTSVTNCAKQLLAIPKLEEQKKEPQLQDIWNRLKSSVGSRGLSRPSELTDLQELVIAVFEATLLDDVIKAYDEFIDSAETKPKVPVDNDIEELVKRPMEEILEGIIDKVTKDPREQEYINNIVQNKMLLETDGSKYSRQCLWILHTARHPGITSLKTQMQTKWPTLSESQRLHRYALEYGQLFNLVSVISKHGPGVKTPINCEPNEEDFQAYVNHLAVTESEEISFVAGTLYKPLNS